MGGWGEAGVRREPYEAKSGLGKSDMRRLKGETSVLRPSLPSIQQRATNIAIARRRYTTSLLVVRNQERQSQGMPHVDVKQPRSSEKTAPYACLRKKKMTSHQRQILRDHMLGPSTPILSPPPAPILRHPFRLPIRQNVIGTADPSPPPSSSRHVAFSPLRCHTIAPLAARPPRSTALLRHVCLAHCRQASSLPCLFSAKRKPGKRKHETRRPGYIASSSRQSTTSPSSRVSPSSKINRNDNVDVKRSSRVPRPSEKTAPYAFLRERRMTSRQRVNSPRPDAWVHTPRFPPCLDESAARHL
ncbi:hypothetical protein R3P38DRAFT_1375278 [Favolaschia claudopus]|uniref:Uncharacterized protein n=1 Tax=Favolaschia claudopus TaxID=2862362 RepID=A0AAW0DZY5_9AGAR